VHSPYKFASFLRLVDVTGVQRPLVAGSFTQRLLELELENVTDEVSAEVRNATQCFCKYIHVMQVKAMVLS